MTDQMHHMNPTDNTSVSEQELLDYLNNRLSAEARKSVEERMAQSELLQDAAEGLQLVENKDALPEVVTRLNRTLINQLQKKRRRKSKSLPSQQLLVTAILLLLLLIVLAFMIIYRSYSVLQ